MTVLDDYFPREQREQRPAAPGRSDDDGVIQGLHKRRKRTTGGGARSPHTIGKKAEELTRYLFNKVLGASVTKSQVQEIVTKRGVFHKSTDVDLVGSMPLVVNGGVSTVPLKIEVKGMAARTFPLSRISENERGYLNAGLLAGAGCLVALIVWPDGEKNIGRGTVSQVFLVPWQRWLMLEQQLEGRAKGNYTGKSLRRKDFDLLDGCEVVRVSRRWRLCGGHWLAQLLPGKDAQAVTVF